MKYTETCANIKKAIYVIYHSLRSAMLTNRMRFWFDCGVVMSHMYCEWPLAVRLTFQFVL